MTDIEYRNQGGLELRDNSEGLPTIVGYASVFNSPAEIQGIREVVLPGAFERVLSEAQDVFALVEHDMGRVLGRSRSGTLRLNQDQRGLRMEIDPPDTAEARDLITSIKRGDRDGASIGFTVPTDGQKFRTEKGVRTREIHSFDRLRDVSVVTKGAFADARVALRSLEEWEAEEAKERARRERETMRMRLELAEIA